MQDFFRRIKSHTKSDSAQPKVQEPESKKSGLGRFGSPNYIHRSQIVTDEASNAGPSSIVHKAEQQSGSVSQLTHAPLVDPYEQTPAGSNEFTATIAESLGPGYKEEFIAKQANAVHPVTISDPIVVPCDYGVVPNEPSEGSITLPASPSAESGEQLSNIDASVHVSQEGVSFNIGASANVTFLYGSQISQHREEHHVDTVIRNLQRSFNAEYDMTASTNRGPCTPETRTTILQALADWCNSDDVTLYWMNGMAGTGKTTIVYSLCEMLAKADLLGASFFCSRSLPDCRDSDIIIPTIAFQLAKKYAPFAEALAEALEKDEGILRRGLDIQLHRLLIDPWNKKKLQLPPHSVVVLDALDECEKGHSALLKAISNQAGKLPFKIMVTSRPEPSICSVLLAKDPETLTTFILHEVEDSLVEEDIARYVESELKECSLSISSSEVRQLSKQCGKFFIYAATLCRFIMDEEGNHIERFKLLLSLSPSDAREIAIQPIDALYIAILRQAFSCKKLHSEKNGIKMVLHIVVCAKEPLTRDAIGDLLELSIEEVEGRLKFLQSLIFVPYDVNQPLSTFHASFPDFMLDSTRSGEFHCESRASHFWIFKQCLALMKRELRQNICDLDGRPPNDTIDPEVIHNHIPRALRYASIFWSEHWSLSDHLERRTVFTLIGEFFMTSVLCWFECLSLAKNLAVAIESLERLRDAHTEDSSLADITHEYLRFIQHVYGAIEYSAMETYFSALAWIPSQSPIRIIYSPLCKKVPQIFCGLQTCWMGPDQIINIHSTQISSIAISRDGRHIVSASLSMRIWNVYSHMEEHALGGYFDRVNSVAITGDGSHVISGYDDGIVRVWNITTRKASHVLQSNNCVHTVTMSPNDKTIASGCKNGLVHIWDAADGHLIQSFRGHTNAVFSVSFTPDGTRLASGSEDQTARIWNMTTRQMECVLHGHTDKVTSVACSPSDDKIATGSSDTTARLWDTSGRMLRILSGHLSDINCVAFMPKGEWVVTGSHDRTLRIWDVASGDTIHEFTGLSDPVDSVAVFPDGLKIASSSDNTISIWSLSSGNITSGKEEKSEVPFSNVEANSMAFSGNGRRVLLLPSFRILDTVTLEEKAVLVSGGMKYHCGALSTLGNRVAACHGGWSTSGPGVIKVWELTDDDVVRDQTTLEGHTKEIFSISFSYNERQLVSTSIDGTVRVWDVTTRK